MLGKLIYVMGPSGAGKDALIQFARSRLDRDSRVVFAHRYITRPQQPAAHENYITLTEAEFALRQRHGLFLLDWQAHGLSYGIGIEAALWRERGLTVVVNGARSFFFAAHRRYPQMRPVYIQVPKDILRERLVARGRETLPEIEERLARPSEQIPSECTVIDNSGAIELAGNRLLALLEEAAGQLPAN